jgi:hypothetical protein
MYPQGFLTAWHKLVREITGLAVDSKQGCADFDRYAKAMDVYIRTYQMVSFQKNGAEDLTERREAMGEAQKAWKKFYDRFEDSWKHVQKADRAMKELNTQ